MKSKAALKAAKATITRCKQNVLLRRNERGLKVKGRAPLFETEAASFTLWKQRLILEPVENKNVYFVL